MIGGQGAPGIGANYNTAPAGHGIEGLRIVEGREPDGRDEVVLDRTAAERAAYDVGDTVRLVSSADEALLEPTLVGIADFGENGSLNGATMVLFDTRTAQQ